MRVRLLVIAAFVSVVAALGLLAYRAGVLPSAERGSGGDPVGASPEFRVTALGWPGRALGLASTPQRVVWEQRSSDRADSGLWAYEAERQLFHRLLGPRDMGLSNGFPSADGATIAWAARPHDAKDGPLQIRAFDTDTRRRFTVSAHGAAPNGAGNTMVWIDTRGGRRAARKTISGRNTVTEERFFIRSGDVVREVAAWGRLVAWTTGARDAAHVWATDRRRAARFQLSAAGTGVAVDRRRVVWAARAGTDGSAIMVWNLRTRRSKELCRVAAVARSLDLEGDLAVWVQDSGGGDVWAYDFKRRRSFPVCSDGAEQASPVLVGRTVFWADRRSGQWELHGRILEQ